MKLVSFYCDVGTEKYYTECSLIFKNNCKKLGIDHLVINESFGENWIDNVRAKPIFLLKMINELNEDLTKHISSNWSSFGAPYYIVNNLIVLRSN